MLHAYQLDNRALRRMDREAPLSGAVWIDLYRPLPEQVAAVEGLGIAVPTLADMEEIEISNRLYHEDAADTMTVVLPGRTPDGEQIAAPVSFILRKDVLVTVRHHAPRPFETFPDRAGRSTAGCATADRVFLGLIEEIVARLADLLEGAGRQLDTAAGLAFRDEAPQTEELQDVLRQVGRQGEALGRIRLGLLTVERALSFLMAQNRHEPGELRSLVKSMLRDIQSLSVHGDFLSSRVTLAVDSVLGLINLAQNATVRIVSVVAALFMPPTLVASCYGMNFRLMPELDWTWGYPIALALMAGSAATTYLFFRWKKWL